jgi:hypothetical protein
MREKLNRIRAAVESGRLHELMRGEASSSLKRAGSVATFDRKATIQWFDALTNAELANVCKETLT